MDTKEHWDEVYASNAMDEVSWFQPRSETSLRLIKETNVPFDAPIIDVGGGASNLVDDLLHDGFTNLSVLDISAKALEISRERVEDRGGHVDWIAADITAVDLFENSFAVWHDRAVFHFLTDPDDRRKYVDRVAKSVVPGGHVIVATFGPDGPLRCSGMDVVRYSPDMLLTEFGATFELVGQHMEMHQTPFQTQQQFVYCYFRRVS